MCITAWPASLSGTITGTWEVLADGKIQHVIWYQNRVQGSSSEQYWADKEHQMFEGIVDLALQNSAMPWDLIGRGFRTIDINVAKSEVEWRKNGGRARNYPEAKAAVLGLPYIAPTGTGNCLVIPLLGTWESIRLLNTADTPNILSDIHKAIELPVMRDMPVPAALSGMQAQSVAAGRMVFLKFDVYDIVIAENAESIPAVLPQIDEEKRPEVNDEVFKTFGDWYRCPVAVCCFKSSEQAEAKPIAFAFEPTDPDRLVVYTLDAHDGHAPDPNATVIVDHTIFVGSYLTPGEHAARVHFEDPVPYHLGEYVLDYVMGLPDLCTEMLNGDFVFDIQDVRRGIFKAARQLPRYAPQRQSCDSDIIRTDPYTNGSKPALIQG